MIIPTSVNKAIAIAAASLVAAGCATTQTAAFRRMSAEDHEKVGSSTVDSEEAVAHQTAAKDMRRAEQAACFEVPDGERDAGPFARRDQIVAVEVLRERLFPKAPPQKVGVAVYLRASPGMTEQWIGRVIECHLAHRAVVGARVAEQACPLSLEEARVGVSSTFAGFRVAITSKDLAVARSLIERCSALAN
jgi:hypothetical protein